MKKDQYTKKNYFLTIVCAIIIVVLLVGCKEDAQNNKKTKVVSELEILVSSSQEDDFYSELPQIVEEIKSFNDDDVLSVLNDDGVTEITKHIIIEQIPQINNGQGIKAQSKFEEFLKDDNLDKSNKIALIHTLEFEDIQSLDILKEIVYAENSEITTNALRKIERISAKVALDISNDIITDCGNYGDYQIKSAVMIKSDYLRDMSVTDFRNVSETEIEEYISFCISNYEKATDNVFGDAMIFSLMDINHIKAVTAIITHSGIDEVLKSSCVAKNYQTFLKLLETDISDENLKCIIKAMEIAPIKEIGAVLKEKDLSGNLYDHDSFNVVIEKIEKNGTAANQKWIIENSKYNW